jgi:hypothetical protein
MINRVLQRLEPQATRRSSLTSILPSGAAALPAEAPRSAAISRPVNTHGCSDKEKEIDQFVPSPLPHPQFHADAAQRQTIATPVVVEGSCSPEVVLGSCHRSGETYRRHSTGGPRSGVGVLPLQICSTGLVSAHEYREDFDVRPMSYCVEQHHSWLQRLMPYVVALTLAVLCRKQL